jgi:hypothetical protein
MTTVPDSITPDPATDSVPSPSPNERAALEAARERAIRLLTDRFADDTLTVDEFEARLDRMYKAATPADLDALTSDLVGTTSVPAVVPPAGSGAAATIRAAMGTRPYPAPGETPPLRRILSLMSETKHTGRWVVPRRLDVRAIMGDLFLDLRDAALPPGLCEMDVLAIMSNVKILVPPGVVVEGLLTAVMAAVGNDAEDDGRLPASAVRIRLTGTAFMAEVRVRVAPPGEPAKQAWRHARRGGWG